MTVLLYSTILIILILFCVILIICCKAYFLLKKSVGVQENWRMIEIYKSYYQLLNQWLKLKQDNKSILNYIQSRDIKTVAIYGKGDLGKRLYCELKNASVSVRYFADKTFSNTPEFKIPSIHPNQIINQEKVDLMIITPFAYYSEISHDIPHNTVGAVVSIEEVIAQAWRENQ